jgi:Skp family chaperone for outer membrane proteins
METTSRITEEDRGDYVIGTVEPIENWASEEIDQLRDDVETMESKLEQARTDADRWEHKYRTLHHDFNEKVKAANQQAQEGNLKLRDKMIIMVDLMGEYETMLDMYVNHTGVRLKTNNLLI